jgi:hypothetical protein
MFCIIADQVPITRPEQSPNENAANIPLRRFFRQQECNLVRPRERH